MFWWCCADFSNMAARTKKETEHEQHRTKFHEEQTQHDAQFTSIFTYSSEYGDSYGVGVNEKLVDMPHSTLSQSIMEAFFTLLSSTFLLLTFPFSLPFSLKFIGPFERLVVMRLGRIKGVCGPGGSALVLPWVDKATRVDLRVSSIELPVLHSLTADRGMVELSVTVFSQVTDPLVAHCTIQNMKEILYSLAYTTISRRICKLLLSDLTKSDSLERVLAKCQEELNSFVCSRGCSVERVAVTRLNVLKPADTGDTAMSILHTLARSQLGQQLFQQLGSAFLPQLQQQTFPLNTAVLPEVIIGDNTDRSSAALSPIMEEPVGFVVHDKMDPDLVTLLDHIRAVLCPSLVQRVRRLFRVRCCYAQLTPTSATAGTGSNCKTAVFPEFDIDLRNGDGWCGWTWERAGPPSQYDVHFTLQKCTLLSLVNGSLSPMSAYLDGRVQIDGSVQDATLLKHLAEALVAFTPTSPSEERIV